ncbi:MAG: MFS transporter [Treponema sp.]|nr:MFS transporter [Treponema sp.]
MPLPGEDGGNRPQAAGPSKPGSPGGKRNRLLFTASFFFSLASNILSFSLVYLLTDRFNFSPGQVGTYLAAGSLCYFLCCNLYHRFAIRPTLLIPSAAALSLLSSVVLGQAAFPWLAALAYALIQGSAGFFWPPIMAWFTQGLDETALNRDISVFNRSWMSGNLLGPLVSGALYHRSSNLCFLALNLSYALVLVMLAIQVRRELRTEARPAAEYGPSPDPRKAAPIRAPEIPLAAVREKAMDWFRYRGWIGGFCTNCFVGVLINMAPLHIRDGLGYTERIAGMALFTRCVSGLIGFTILAKAAFWHFNRRWFLLTQAALALCAFAFVPAGNRVPLYFGIIFIYGFVHACCYNNSIFHSSATGKSPRKNLALHEIFLSIGSAAGAAGGGFCYQRFGFAGTFAALGIVMTLGMAFFVLLEYRRPG